VAISVNHQILMVMDIHPVGRKYIFIMSCYLHNIIITLMSRVTM
jgi:hypothetical protein